MNYRFSALFAAPLLIAGLAQAQAPVPVTPPAKAVAHQKVRAKRFAARKAGVKGLNLSDAQKSKIKSIRQQERASAQPVADKLKANRQALSAAEKSNDTAQIQALSKEQGELRGQAMAIRSQSRAQIYAGLTEEQRTRLNDRQARMQRRLEKRQARKA